MNEVSDNGLYKHREFPSEPTHPKKSEPMAKTPKCPNKDEEGYCKYQPEGKRYRCKGSAAATYQNCEVFLKIKNGRIILNG